MWGQEHTMAIDYAKYQYIGSVDLLLCQGEQDCLTDAEVIEINESLRRASEQMQIVGRLSQQAKLRFAAKQMLANGKDLW